jgi:hypothetical protein
MNAIGRKIWAIAEGYIPGESFSADRRFVSHEAARILNAGGEPAQIKLTVFFAGRGPAGPYRLTAPAQRTLHLRCNDLCDPEPIPRNTDYASLLESDVPVIAQHTRLDGRDPHIALLSTIAFPVDQS